MAEEQASGNNQEEQDYIDALNTMKQNTVPKEKYDKLKEENKKLLDSFVNGKDIEGQEHKPEIKVDELRSKLYGSKGTLNNLDYIDTTLKLRQKILDDGSVDPFVPQGNKISPTRDDFETAQHVADVLQQCVDAADGDVQAFTSELARNINK